MQLVNTMRRIRQDSSFLKELALSVPTKNTIFCMIKKKKKKSKKSLAGLSEPCDRRAMIIHPGIERLWAQRALVVMQDEDS